MTLNIELSNLQVVKFLKFVKILTNVKYGQTWFQIWSNIGKPKMVPLGRALHGPSAPRLGPVALRWSPATRPSAGAAASWPRGSSCWDPPKHEQSSHAPAPATSCLKLKLFAKLRLEAKCSSDFAENTHLRSNAWFGLYILGFFFSWILFDHLFFVHNLKKKLKLKLTRFHENPLYMVHDCTLLYIIVPVWIEQNGLRPFERSNLFVEGETCKINPIGPAASSS